MKTTPRSGEYNELTAQGKEAKLFQRNLVQSEVQRLMSKQLRELNRTQLIDDPMSIYRLKLALKEALQLMNPKLAAKIRFNNLVDGQSISTSTYTDKGELDIITTGGIIPLGSGKLLRIGGQSARSLILGVATPTIDANNFGDAKFLFRGKYQVPGMPATFPLLPQGELTAGDLVPILCQTTAGAWLFPTNEATKKDPVALPIGFTVNTARANDTSFRCVVELLNVCKSTCQLVLQFRSGTTSVAKLVFPVAVNTSSFSGIVNASSLVNGGVADNVVLYIESWEKDQALKSVEIVCSVDSTAGTYKLYPSSALTAYPNTSSTSCLWASVNDSKFYTDLKDANLDQKPHCTHGDLIVLTNLGLNLNKGGAITSCVTYSPLTFNLQEDVVSGTHTIDGNSDAQLGVSHHFVPTNSMLDLAADSVGDAGKRQCLFTMLSTGSNVGNKAKYSRYMSNHLSTTTHLYSPYSNEIYLPAMDDARVLIKDHAGTMVHTNAGHIDTVKAWWNDKGRPLLKRIGNIAFDVGVDALAAGAAAIVVGL